MREMELVGAKASDKLSGDEGAEQALREMGNGEKKSGATAISGGDDDEDDAPNNHSNVADDRSDEAPLLPAAASTNGASAAAADEVESLQEMENRFAAYVRDDCYGALGRGELPPLEKVKLFVAMLTIVPLRFVALLLVLLVYYIICRVFTLFRSPSDEEGQENYEYLRGFRRYIIVASGRFLARVMLFVLGFYWINVTHVGHDSNSAEGGAPGAIVSNHVSYLDILYHMSASFPSFVAKRSVAKLPLVGLISKCLGCVYVQRESKTSDTKGVSGIVSERLRAAHTQPGSQMMLLFPEGTTTNGKHLLPFKTGAFLSKTPVMPVILKYPYRRFSPAWESISGTRHILFLLCQPINFLEVTRLPVYCPPDKEKADPKLFAASVRSLMAAEGGLTISDIGLQEKRIYLNALRT